jgi:prepilin-type N-terminal cleavage/methylation domain-containing protein
MFKLMRKNRKGFTLIELIVVIAILAILAAIAIPTFTSITNKANDNVKVANATSIATAINSFNALNPDDDALASKPESYSTAATTVGDLWPSGLSADEYEAAWDLVQVSNRVATIDRGSSPAAS